MKALVKVYAQVMPHKRQNPVRRAHRPSGGVGLRGTL